MGSEQIHYEALRKQSIMDKRSSLNIRRIFHTPPYQPYYVTYELPKDDMYIPREYALRGAPVYEAKPTIQQFTTINISNEPWKFMSLKSLHGNSSASHRQYNEDYSAKIKSRYNNIDYLKQW